LDVKNAFIYAPIVRDFTNYIGRRNYSEVPMQANADLFVSDEPTPEQAAWVSRFPYAAIVGKIVYLTAITRRDIAYAVSNARSKHIDVKFHWLREQVLLTVTQTKPKTGEPFHRNAMQLVTSILDR
jgi:hypothetical protein